MKIHYTNDLLLGIGNALRLANDVANNQGCAAHVFESKYTYIITTGSGVPKFALYICSIQHDISLVLGE